MSLFRIIYLVGGDSVELWCIFQTTNKYQKNKMLFILNFTRACFTTACSSVKLAVIMFFLFIDSVMIVWSQDLRVDRWTIIFRTRDKDCGGTNTGWGLFYKSKNIWHCELSFRLLIIYISIYSERGEFLIIILNVQKFHSSAKNYFDLWTFIFMEPKIGFSTLNFNIFKRKTLDVMYVSFPYIHVWTVSKKICQTWRCV